MNEQFTNIVNKIMQKFQFFYCLIQVLQTQTWISTMILSFPPPTPPPICSSGSTSHPPLFGSSPASRRAPLIASHMTFSSTTLPQCLRIPNTGQPRRSVLGDNVCNPHRMLFDIPYQYKLFSFFGGWGRVGIFV